MVVQGLGQIYFNNNISSMYMWFYVCVTSFNSCFVMISFLLFLLLLSLLLLSLLLFVFLSSILFLLIYDPLLCGYSKQWTQQMLRLDILFPNIDQNIFIECTLFDDWLCYSCCSCLVISLPFFHAIRYSFIIAFQFPPPFFSNTNMRYDKSLYYH